MAKKNIASAPKETILKLKILAKEKENVRGKLAVKAKKLATTAKKKETTRGHLAVTAETLRLKAKKLATTAQKKENIKNKLEITAKQLAKTAKEKEDVRKKLAEIAKAKAEITARYEATLLSISDGMIAVDKNERIIFISKATEKMFGWKFNEVKNKNFNSIVRVFDEKGKLVPHKNRPLYIALTKGKKAVYTTYSYTKKNGTIFPVSSFVAPILLKGKIIGSINNFRDISKEEKLIKEKESVRNKLVITAKNLAKLAKEKEIVRGKLEITAKKLAKVAKEVELANKELRALDLAKDEFVSIASHQLRTPLTALKGYTGMLLDGDAGPINKKQHEYLTEIKNANDRMIDLITSLLNVSRVDLGVFIVEPELIDFKKVAESVLSELDIKIKEKKLKIVVSFAKDLPLISADLKIVRMVFQNLLSNAVKYTPPGGKISFDIEKDASTILVSVADTGYGIPANVQSKIFTKMFRADNARLKDPTGTGLGLYIVKETVEKIGGKIWFKSKENQGSTFYFSIPLRGMKKKEGSKRLE